MPLRGNEFYAAKFGADYARTRGKWTGMWQRVKRPTGRNKCYAGLAVDERWLVFENFLTDMGHCPEGLTLDRIDPTKDYGPDNCRWADCKTQSRNRKSCSRRKIDMETAAKIRSEYSLGGATQTAIAARYGITQPMVGRIIHNRNWV